MHFVGIDVGKDELVMSFITEAAEAQPSKPRLFPQSRTGFRRLAEAMPPLSDAVVLLEATGVYGKRLEQHLLGLGAVVYRVNPRIIRHCGTRAVSTKTDHADALAIARACRRLYRDDPRTLEHGRLRHDEHREALQVWMCERMRLTEQIAVTRTRLQALAAECSREAAQRVARMHRARLRTYVRQARRIGARMEQLARCADATAVDLLCSIPGIGTLTASVVVCLVPNVNRYESADAFKAHFGIYPARRQSGIARREGPSHLARHGNRYLRATLWNCARSAMRHNPRSIALASRLAAAGKSFGCICGAVMRQLMQQIYGVLRSGRPFDPLMA
jgi:transposase